MRLNVIYQGGIDVHKDILIEKAAALHAGEHIGSGCWFTGDRDIELLFPNTVELDDAIKSIKALGLDLQINPLEDYQEEDDEP